MRLVIGESLFMLGMIGMLWGRGRKSSGYRGWAYWDRDQKIICSVSAAVVLAGLIVAGAQ